MPAWLTKLLRKKPKKPAPAPQPKKPEQPKRPPQFEAAWKMLRLFARVRDGFGEPDFYAAVERHDIQWDQVNWISRKYTATIYFDKSGRHGRVYNPYSKPASWTFGIRMTMVDDENIVRFTMFTAYGNMLKITWDARTPVDVADAQRRAVHAAAAEKQRFAYGIPKRRASMLHAANWTTKTYKETCDYMRGLTSEQTPRVKRTLTALQTYMKHTALVAPAAPRGSPSVSTLWRGVQLSPIATAVPRPGDTVASNGGCFTAFSYDFSTAGYFASKGDQGGFVYRLQTENIARGTPWIWFTEPHTHKLPPRWQDAVGTKALDEKEVLLPPGYFKVLRTTTAGEFPIVDVAFFPRPQYVRRGAVPRIDNQGRATVKTVGGHHLVTDHAAAVKNVKDRRNRIVAAAARRVRRT